MTTTKSLSTFFFLCVTLILTAQTDTSIVSKQIDELLATGKIETPSPKYPKSTTLSFTLGTTSAFKPDEKYMDGTNRNYIKNFDWIPVSFKVERFLAKRYSMGLRVSVVNNQRIYDAIWKNYSTQKTEQHRFTHIQNRVSFLFRQNLYIIKRPQFEFFWGLGVGLTYFKQVKMVMPYAYEYGGSGESDFLNIIGIETSLGIRYYPFPKRGWGLMAEGGIMQSLGRFGISYRIPNKNLINN